MLRVRPGQLEVIEKARRAALEAHAAEYLREIWSQECERMGAGPP